MTIIQPRRKLATRIFPYVALASLTVLSLVPIPFLEPFRNPPGYTGRHFFSLLIMSIGVLFLARRCKSNIPFAVSGAFLAYVHTSIYIELVTWQSGFFRREEINFPFYLTCLLSFASTLLPAILTHRFYHPPPPLRGFPIEPDDRPCYADRTRAFPIEPYTSTPTNLAPSSPKGTLPLQSPAAKKF